MSFQGHLIQCEDIRQRIFKSHLAYLNQEETPAKLEQRHILESLIAEFLCLVPSSEKFIFPEIHEILHKSIIGNPHFNGCKGSVAFEALEKYSTNLISHPWRKEYKVIKLYSGFYKHHVETQLLSAEAIFSLLGYVQNEDSMLFLDEPVDPDRVARVALDCLTAYVECQIMIQICEKVKSFKCTWAEIHNVRQEYICGIDESVRILHQLKRAALNEEKYWLKNKDAFEAKDKHLDPRSSYQKVGVLVDMTNGSDTYSDGSLNHSSLHSLQEPSKSQAILMQSKSPSSSEAVSSYIDGFQGKNSSIKITNSEKHTQLSSDSLKSCWSIIESQTQPKPPSVCQDDSWNFLYSLPKQQFHEGSSTYSESSREKECGHMPFSKAAYNSHYLPHFSPPIIHPNFAFSSHGAVFHPPPPQCHCQMCCEQPFSVFQNRFHHSDMLQNYLSADSLYSREDKHAFDGAQTLTNNILHLSLGHSPSGQFPTELSPPKRTVSNSSQISCSQKSQNATNRASIYDNVPADFMDTSCSVGNAVSSKREGCTQNCSNSSTNMKNKSQRGVTIVDSSHSNQLVKLDFVEPSSATDPVLSNKTTAITADSIMVNLPKFPSALNTKRWGCISCTFINPANKRICEMCGRSRYPGAESTPLLPCDIFCPVLSVGNVLTCLSLPFMYAQLILYRY